MPHVIDHGLRTLDGLEKQDFGLNFKNQAVSQIHSDYANRAQGIPNAQRDVAQVQSGELPGYQAGPMGLAYAQDLAQWGVQPTRPQPQQVDPATVAQARTAAGMAPMQADPLAGQPAGSPRRIEAAQAQLAQSRRVNESNEGYGTRLLSQGMDKESAGDLTMHNAPNFRREQNESPAAFQARLIAHNVPQPEIQAAMQKDEHRTKANLEIRKTANSKRGIGFVDFSIASPDDPAKNVLDKAGIKDGQIFMQPDGSFGQRVGEDARQLSEAQVNDEIGKQYRLKHFGVESVQDAIRVRRERVAKGEKLPGVAPGIGIGAAPVPDRRGDALREQELSALDEQAQKRVAANQAVLSTYRMRGFMPEGVDEETLNQIASDPDTDPNDMRLLMESIRFNPREPGKPKIAELKDHLPERPKSTEWFKKGRPKFGFSDDHSPEEQDAWLNEGIKNREAFDAKMSGGQQGTKTMYDWGSAPVQTAVNPATGQRIYLRNGKWVDDKGAPVQ